MTRLFGRKVLLATLDSVPASFRFAPGIVVVSQAEANAIASGEPNTLAHFKRLIWKHDRARMMEALRQAEAAT